MGGDGGCEFGGEVGGVPFDDLVVDDGVADGEEGADEVVEVDGPHVVPAFRDLAEEPFESIGYRARDVAALLEVCLFGEAVEWVEAGDGDGFDKRLNVCPLAFVNCNGSVGFSYARFMVMMMSGLSWGMTRL